MWKIFIGVTRLKNFHSYESKLLTKYLFAKLSTSILSGEWEGYALLRKSLLINANSKCMSQNE